MYTRISFHCPFCDRPKQVDVDVEDEVICPDCGRTLNEDELREQEAGREDYPEDDFIDSNPWEHGPDGDLYG